MQSKIGILFITLLIGALTASCAKKATGVRSVRQTETRTLNPLVSDPSVNAAEAANLLYKLTVIELPTADESGSLKVISEIQTPSGQFVPMTTTHVNGQDAYGVVNDTQNGKTIKLDVRARCIGTGCEAYVMLITVVKDNYAYHQIAAVSYKAEEQFFNVENLNAKVTNQFYTTLDAVILKHNVK